jgi:penicillin-binding protein-related factor A (putative recombinase)
MLESNLVYKIMQVLKAKTKCKWLKIHGGPYQEAGISDIVGCYKGIFIALEVKLPGKEGELSALQNKFLKDIITSGGIGHMITSVKQALDIIDRIDQGGYNECFKIKALRLSKKGNTKSIKKP